MHPQWCLWISMDTTENRICSKLLPECRGSVSKGCSWPGSPMMCDTLEADGIESVIPVKHLCYRSFIKRLCWWILLSQSYFWLVANPLESWQVQHSELVPFSAITYQNRRLVFLDCRLGGFADLPLSQEISDFKPSSRFQNIHNTDMKYQHKLIEADCSSCLWSYNLFFHIMHHPNQNTVVSVLSALHWLKKKNPNFKPNLSFSFFFFFQKNETCFIQTVVSTGGKGKERQKRA